MTETNAQPADSEQAVRSILEHHTQLAAHLTDRVQALLAVVRTGGDVDEARGELVAFLDDALMPHAAAEEQTLYVAARDLPRGRLLVEGMIAEHRALADRVSAVRDQRERIELAATAAEIRALFSVHLYKENDLMLPLLVEEKADLPALLHNTHHLLSHDAHGEHAGH